MFLVSAFVSRNHRLYALRGLFAFEVDGGVDAEFAENRFFDFVGDGVGFPQRGVAVEADVKGDFRVRAVFVAVHVVQVEVVAAADLRISGDAGAH